jgi:hypothetical protein
MKNNKVAILLILVLTSIAFWLINKEDVRSPRKDFAIKDTDRITKIVIASKEPRVATLERQSKGWTVNGEHPARQTHIDVLLKTLRRMEARNQVSEAAKENIYKRMITAGTQVDIYEDDQILKTIYIGGSPQDQMGTYMMLKGSSTAYVVHIPGFNGFLSSRFFASELDWRNHNIFSVDNPDLAYVELNYPSQPERSFRLEQANGFQLKNHKGESLAVNENMAQKYVSLFRNVNFEAFLNDKKLVNKDSIINTTPIFELTVAEKNGKEKKMRAFLKKAQAGTTNHDGSPKIYDKERMYASIDDDLVLIQHYSFNKIMRELKDLKKVE